MRGILHQQVWQLPAHAAWAREPCHGCSVNVQLASTGRQAGRQAQNVVLQSIMLKCQVQQGCARCTWKCSAVHTAAVLPTI